MPTRPSGLLSDVVELVWPGGAYELTRQVRPVTGAEDFLVLPTPGSPRWLLPASHRADVAAFTATSPPPLSRAGLTHRAHRTGMLRRLPLARVRVHSGGERSLHDELSEALGERVTAVYRIGSWPHARSFVARVLDATGDVIAFAKLGVDAHGRAAVEAERAALVHLEERGFDALEHPAPIHAAHWHDARLLVLAPLIGTTGQQHMPVGEMRALAAVDGLAEHELGDGPWHSSVRRRLTDVRRGPARARLTETADQLLRAGRGLRVTHGSWHGDWTPWNMSRAGSRVLLWDWEHFTGGVPVGWDALHYRSQELRKAGRTDRAAERLWLSEAPGLLAQHSESRDPVAQLVVAAYLLEVNLRYVLDRQGTSLERTPRQGWGLGLLTELTRELGRTSPR